MRHQVFANTCRHGDGIGRQLALGVSTTTYTSTASGVIALLLSRYRLITTLLIVVAMLGGSLSAILATEQVHAGASTITKSLVDPGPFKPGQEVRYRLTVACSSLVASCGATTVTDELDPSLEYVSTSEPSGWVPNVNGQTVTFQNPSFVDGESVELIITTRIRPSAEPGVAIPNSARLEISEVDAGQNRINITEPVVIVPEAGTPKYHVTKRLVGADPLPGGNSSYVAEFCASTQVGNADLTDVHLVDTFPEGAVVVDAAGGTVSGNTITWSLADVDLSTLTWSEDEACFVQFHYTLNFPADDFPTGTELENTVRGSGTAPDGTHIGPSAAVSTTVSTDKINLDFAKIAAGQTAAGGSVNFRLELNPMGSTVPIPNVTVEDEITIDQEILAIAAENILSGHHVDIDVSTDNRATWQRIATEMSGIRSSVPRGDIPPGVTHVRWDFYRLVDGARVDSILPSEKLRALVHFGVSSDTDIGSVLTNCATLSYAAEPPEEDCASTTIVVPVPDVRRSTMWMKPKSAVPGDEIEVFLRLHNIQKIADVIHPVITDLMPEGLEFLGLDLDHPSASLSSLSPPEAPVLEIVENWNDTGRKLVRLSWPNSLLAYTHEANAPVVVLRARVEAGTQPGEMTNTATFSAHGNETRCGSSSMADTEDRDGDGDTSELVCTSSDTVEVRTVGAVAANKWVIGDSTLEHVDSSSLIADPTCPDDDGYTRFPCAAQTGAGGPGAYRIVVTNLGNQPLEDYVLYDVIPHVGDFGVSELLASNERGSAWTPQLSGLVQPVGGAAGIDQVIEYSDSVDACRPEISSSTDETGWQTDCVDDWTTAPDDLADVKAFRIRIRFDTPFAPGDTLSFEVPIVAPLSAPTGSIAWNSIAHRVTNAATGERLATAEARKVGIRVPESPTVPTYRLGNLVWADHDDDGVAEEGEPGIEGVTVTLYRDDDGVAGPSEGDTEMTTTVTDADGHYWFAGLEAGDYYVAIEDGQSALDGWASSTNAGSPPADHDNDDDGHQNLRATEGAPVDGLYSSIVSLGEGDGSGEPTDETVRADSTVDDDDDADAEGGYPDARSNLSVDFGFYQLRLGNRVWLDNGAGVNADNGTLDDDENGIAGATVELWTDTDGSGDLDPAEDTMVTRTTTDAEGRYLFDGLKRDVAYIVAVPEEANTGSDEPLEALRSSTGTFTGDDNRDDGAPRPGYASVAAPVTLKPATTPTGETEGDSGEDSETFANSIGSSLEDGNSDLTVDFGFVEPPTYRLGNLVWDDTDNDGLAEPGEPGIAGVEVVLWADDDGVPGPSAGDTRIGASETDAGGHYLFEELDAGEYYVVIPEGQTPLDGYRSSDRGEEADADADGDNNDNGSPSTDGDIVSSVVTLGEGNGFDEPTDETLRSGDATGDENGAHPDNRSNLTVDFGFYRLSLGNQVWFDTDNNGVLDPGESPIPDVTVELYLDTDGDGVPDSDTSIATDRTDQSGLYLFGGLEHGTTNVVVIPSENFGSGRPLEGYRSSDPEMTGGGVDGRDNGINPDTVGDDVVSAPVTMEAGAEPTGEDPDDDPATPDTNSDLTVDFGFYTMNLGNRVWFDTDNDGLHDEGEAGIEGVEIQLWADEDGDGQADDVNGDGVVDDEDLIDTVTTDLDGHYLFTGLGEGIYLVSSPSTEFEPAGPLTGTTSSSGSFDDDGDRNDNGIDPDTEGEAIWSAPIVLDAGAAPTGEDAEPAEPAVPDANSNLTVDFGFHSMSLGNRVWLDTIENNGKMDPGEPSVGGVTVQLIDPETGEVVVETVTDETGYYLFTGLRDGDEYIVRIPESNFASGGPLAGYVSTEGNGETPPDPDDDVDQDDNGSGSPGKNVDSAPVTLSAAGEPTGETDLDPDAENLADDANTNSTVDFGFVATPGLSLGNRVWFDTDNSAKRDSDERGASGVTVELFRDDDGDGVADSDTPFQSTVTDENGYYLFSGLAQGDYLVRIPDTQFGEGEPLEGWHSSTGSGDADDDTEDDDSGIDPTDPGGNVWSSVITLSVFDEPTDEADKPTGGLEFDRPDDENANMTVDFGFYQLALGDEIWLGADNDGRRDTDEEPIAGVAVELWADADGDGEPDDLTGDGVIDDDDRLATTTTDADGLYRFTGLAEGNYLVAVPATAWEPDGPLAGLASSSGDGGDPDENVDGNDNGIDPAKPGATVWSAPITLSGGDEPGDPAVTGDTETNLTVDFGFYPLAGLGDRVWIDANRNGVQDEGEESVAGVTVELLDENGDVVATTMTDEDGNYRFEDLVPGTYRVRFDLSTLPEGYKVTEPGAGDDDAADSDGDPTTGETEPTELTGGEYDPTWDLGIVERRSDIELDKQANVERVPAGDDITWTITGTNAGPDALLGGFGVHERLPEGLEVKSWSGEGWDCTFDESENTCRFEGSLEVGETAPALTVVTKTDRSQAGLVVANGVEVADPPGEPDLDHSTVVLSRTTNSSRLAFTGASAIMMVLAGVALASAGAILVLGSRRANRAAQSVI